MFLLELYTDICPLQLISVQLFEGNARRLYVVWWHIKVDYRLSVEWRVVLQEPVSALKPTLPEISATRRKC